jgi:hypothetical protein
MSVYLYFYVNLITLEETNWHRAVEGYLTFYF